MAVDSHGIGFLLSQWRLGGGALVRSSQGQATKLLPLECFGVETNVLDYDSGLFLAHPPILGGATGRFGRIYALNTKDTGYAVAIGAVGQLLIEPKGRGV